MTFKSKNKNKRYCPKVWNFRTINLMENLFLKGLSWILFKSRWLRVLLRSSLGSEPALYKFNCLCSFQWGRCLRSCVSVTPAEIGHILHPADVVWNFPLQVPLGVRGRCTWIGRSLKAAAYTSPEQGGCAVGRFCGAPPDTFTLPHCQELFPVRICCPPVVVLAQRSTLQSLWRKCDFQLCKSRGLAGSPGTGEQIRTVCVCLCLCVCLYACLYCETLLVFIIFYLANYNEFFCFPITTSLRHS